MIDALSSVEPRAAIETPARPAAPGFTSLFRSTVAETENRTTANTGQSAAGESSSATPSSSPYPPGWSGPPDKPGSTYNALAAWNQVPGQQPSWITGNYPGATWDAYSGSGFLIPYGDIPPGPGSDPYTGANMNVINQDWEKFYAEFHDPATAAAIVWGPNNPQHLVSAPWLANNPAIQYTPVSTSDPAVPTQPNYVSPQQFAELTRAADPAQGPVTNAAPAGTTGQSSNPSLQNAELTPLNSGHAGANSTGVSRGSDATESVAASVRDRWSEAAAAIERFTETLLKAETETGSGPGTAGEPIALI